MKDEFNTDCFLDLRALSGRSCLSVRKLRDHIKPERPDCLISYLVGGKRLVRWNDFLTLIARFKEEGQIDIDQILNEVVEFEVRHWGK